MRSELRGAACSPLPVGVHHSQRDVFWSSSLDAKLIKDQLLEKTPA